MRRCTLRAKLLCCLCSAVLLTAGQTPSVDMQLTLNGYSSANSILFQGPVFPVVPLSFSTRASNFAVDWNVAVQWTIRITQTWDRSNRPFALVHLAQYQALRANWGLEVPVEPNVLAAHAAHIVLCNLYPTYKDHYDTLLKLQLQTLLPSVSEAARVVARRVVINLLSQRLNDGSQNTLIDLPAPQGGVVPGTAIGLFAPVGAAVVGGKLVNSGSFENGNYQFANATPILLPTPISEFPLIKDDTGPPELPSPDYNAYYTAGFLLGEDNSTVRTQYQLDTTYFWYQTTNTCGSYGQWNQIALASLESNISLTETATLLAQIAVSTYDTFIAVYYSKVHWQRWRPITAIRQGDCRPGITMACHESVPDWTPLLPTPSNPVYPSFIGGCAGAAEAILVNWYNTSSVSFTIGSEAFATSGRLPGRIYSSFSQASLECCNSRIYGGVELNNDALAGRQFGLEVGAYVAENFEKLDPLSPDVATPYGDLIALIEADQAAQGNV